MTVIIMSIHFKLNKTAPLITVMITHLLHIVLDQLTYNAANMCTRLRVQTANK